MMQTPNRGQALRAQGIKWVCRTWLGHPTKSFTNLAPAESRSYRRYRYPAGRGHRTLGQREDVMFMNGIMVQIQEPNLMLAKSLQRQIFRRQGSKTAAIRRPKGPPPNVV